MNDKEFEKIYNSYFKQSTGIKAEDLTEMQIEALKSSLSFQVALISLRVKTLLKSFFKKTGSTGPK